MDHQNQIDLERLFAKNQTLTRIRSEFETEEWETYLAAWQIPHAFGIDLLAQMVLHRKADMSTLVGILRHHFTNEHGETDEALQACCDMIWRAAEADLIDCFQSHWVFLYRYDVGPDVYDDLDRYQYPLPLVAPPKTIEHNAQNGYHTLKGGVVLNAGHRHAKHFEDDLCLDHLNRVNQQKYQINADTARMVQNQWRGLEGPKPDDEPGDLEKRRKAFEKYDRVGRDVMEMICMTGQPFWLTHRYDSRGRCYAQG